jgi:transcription elongation factor SPT5
MEECSVYIQSLSKTVEIPFAQLTPSVPKAKDTVVVISGENREMQGELIGIDEKDGIVKVIPSGEIKIVDMTTLSKLVIGKSE